MKNIIAQILTPVAEGSIDVGGTWKRSLEIPAGPDGQTRQIEQTFTYKGPDPKSSGLEIIEFSTKYDPPRSTPTCRSASRRRPRSAGSSSTTPPAGCEVDRHRGSGTFDLVPGQEVHQKAETSRVLTLSKDKAP